jgi:quinol monooxygenase YgiN
LLSGGYALVVRFNILAGHEEVFDALAEDTVAAIRMSEPGTLIYLVHREATAPSVRVFYELYRNVEAFEAHEDMAHVRRFLSERGQHLDGEPQVWRITPMAGAVLAELDAHLG